MKAGAKKMLLLLLAALLLLASGQVQRSLNTDRDRLGLTRIAPLDNAPPLLAFTTVALGGFRGLISNFLWIRANDLQQDDKFFEAAQLATWITELEPHFPQVWAFQGWNMAYNISVKFTDAKDRWRWVEHGITLLRDDGLRYNPNDILIHHELSWFFEHKMGANLDEANGYYKTEWAKEMQPFFGPQGTNFADLLHPATPEAVRLLQVLTNQYKIDPVFAKQVDDTYGPLDWRLPEAHAIYWAAQGLEDARRFPDKVKTDDLTMLRRSIFQTMQAAFHHGRVVANPFSEMISLGPDLELIPKVNAAYEQMMAEDEPMRDNIGGAHRNFLRDAVYFLYADNRVADAAKWFKYLCDKYPNKTIIEGDTNSFPRNVTLDQFALATINIDINETSQERVTAMVQGLLAHAYTEMALDQNDRYVSYLRMAQKVYEHYDEKSKVPGKENVRTQLPPIKALNRAVLDQLLDPSPDAPRALPYAARAIIRTQLGMGPETNAPAVLSTNLPAELSPNAPPPAATNPPAVHPVD
jgi:hypothetical protein